MVIAGSDPLLLTTASTVKRAGENIVAIIEQAPMTTLARFATGLWRWSEKLCQFGGFLSTRYYPANQVIQTQGNTCLQSVIVCYQGQAWEMAYGRLAIGYRPIPNIESDAIFGCKTESQAIWIDTDQHTNVQDIYAAGECTGFGGNELALAEGEIIGCAVTNYPQKAQGAISACARWQRFAHALHMTSALPESLEAATTADTLLCRYEGVRCDNVQNAEGWQATKLASRCGMEACQEEVCATSARQLHGQPLPQPCEPFFPARIDTFIRLAKPKG